MTTQSVKRFKDSVFPGGGKFPPQGDVEIVVRRSGKWGYRQGYDRSGKKQVLWLPCGNVEDVVEGGNIITDRFKVQMAHLTVGHETTSRYINKMVWGTGGHAVGDPTTPISPAETDTSLESSILTKNLSTFDFPTSSSVMMVAFILETEANGFTITEEGLIAADRTLVARRTFPGLPKTEDFVFEFRHTFVF